jgi:hypothetical protein
MSNAAIFFTKSTYLGSSFKFIIFHARAMIFVFENYGALLAQRLNIAMLPVQIASAAGHVDDDAMLRGKEF